MKKEEIMVPPVMKFLANPSDTRGEIIGREEWEDILVDTCFTNDTGKFETYISNDFGSAVVEIYKNRKESIKGHKKWVSKLRENPELELKEVGFKEWAGLK